MICKRTRIILSFGREQSCANKKITDNALSQYLLQWHQQTLLSSLFSLGHRLVIVNLLMSSTLLASYCTLFSPFLFLLQILNKKVITKPQPWSHQFVIVNLVMSSTCIILYLLSLSSSQDLQIDQTKQIHSVVSLFSFHNYYKVTAETFPTQITQRPGLRLNASTE